MIPIRDHLHSDNLWLAEVQQKVLAANDEDVALRGGDPLHRDPRGRAALPPA
ncbi:MAG: hypothetical protein VKI81_06940 [Synechococcaceae cyanobacterium]|nr:hypothetical protein [Synechococcaceae cyanobacterium]